MFSCSGAADTAEIADRAVRKVHREDAAKMFCLAGIGGRVELILLNTQAAKSLVAVDGCDTDCAKRTLELCWFQGFHAHSCHGSRHGEGQDRGHVRAHRHGCSPSA